MKFEITTNDCVTIKNNTLRIVIFKEIVYLHTTQFRVEREYMVARYGPHVYKIDIAVWNKFILPYVEALPKRKRK